MHHEPLERRHPIRDALAAALRAARHEPQVALGQQPDEPPRLVNHDQRADAGPRHHRRRFVERRGRRHRVRVGNHAMLRPLDRLDFPHLRLNVTRPEPAVDDADPAFLGLDDGHRRAGHGIHVGGDNRPPEMNPPGEPTGEIDRRGITPLDHAALRGEEKIIEGTAGHHVEQHPTGLGPA